MHNKTPVSHLHHIILCSDAKSPDKEIPDSSLVKFACLCSSGHKTDPSNTEKCILIEPSDDDYYVPSSQSKRRRSIFRTLAIMMLLVLSVSAIYYWFVNRRPRYSNNFQQFVNP